MDTRKQIEIDEIVKAFLMQMPTKRQSEAAKALNIPKKRFNDYYNHRYNPPERLLARMETYLHARGIALNKTKTGKSTDDCGNLSHSERAKQVLADEKWGRKRSGRPKKSETIICHHDDKLKKKNRTDDQLAEKYQFTSRFTLRAAVSVVENGCIELIRVMDQESVSFKCVAKLAQLPKPLQRELAIQDEQSVLDYFKKSGDVEIFNRIDIGKALKLAKEHPRLIQLKTKTQQLFQEIFEEVLYAARC